jgi:hypothetical protein
LPGELKRQERGGNAFPPRSGWPAVPERQQFSRRVIELAPFVRSLVAAMRALSPCDERFQDNI